MRPREKCYLPPCASPAAFFPSPPIPAQGRRRAWRSDRVRGHGGDQEAQRRAGVDGVEGIAGDQGQQVFVGVRDQAGAVDAEEDAGGAWLIEKASLRECQDLLAEVLTYGD